MNIKIHKSCGDFTRANKLPTINCIFVYFLIDIEWRCLGLWGGIPHWSPEDV